MRKGGRGRPLQGKGMDRWRHTGRRWLKHRGGQAGSMGRGRDTVARDEGQKAGRLGVCLPGALLLSDAEPWGDFR